MHSIDKSAAEEHKRTSMLLSVTEMEATVEQLHVALTTGVYSSILECYWLVSLAYDRGSSATCYP